MLMRLRNKQVCGSTPRPRVTGTKFAAPRPRPARLHARDVRPLAGRRSAREHAAVQRGVSRALWLLIHDATGTATDNSCKRRSRMSRKSGKAKANATVGMSTM
jgi:hypothetical protein